jgi:hypothetical protein
VHRPCGRLRRQLALPEPCLDPETLSDPRQEARMRPPLPAYRRSVPDQVAFVVMPFRRKPTGRMHQQVPAELDQPVLGDLGYRAVRADRDAGALIITQMVQRLAIADVVVADSRWPTRTCTTEIGIRHAAEERGYAPRR